jgi:hypothetical protein
MMSYHQKQASYRLPPVADWLKTLVINTRWSSYWNLCDIPRFPPPAKDVVYQALFNVNDTDGEPQEHGDVTIEVISLICTHLYLTVSRLAFLSWKSMESSHSTVLLFIHISVASMCSIDVFGLKCRICFMSEKFFSLARLCFGTEMDSCRLASSSDVWQPPGKTKPLNGLIPWIYKIKMPKLLLQKNVPLIT